jgi:dTDP-4-dehydrorhamnose reductase
MKRILITGANGFLGQHLCKYFSSKDVEVIATGKGVCRLPADFNVKYHAVDLADFSAVKKLCEQNSVDVIIHNAAMSKPDECHRDRKACTAINVDATQHLLSFQFPHFVYLSTDFIFGENGPHAEDVEPAPLNFYGETKWQAEQLVKETTGTYTIVRPVFIYGQSWGSMRGSFLHWVKENLQNGKAIKVAKDQLRTPTYAPDICDGIERIIDQKATGVFHLAGRDILSPYEMAIATAKVLNLDHSLIEPVTADTFPEPVKRAKSSGLKIDKAISELGYAPTSFEEGMRLSFL